MIGTDRKYNWTLSLEIRVVQIRRTTGYDKIQKTILMRGAFSTLADKPDQSLLKM